MARKREVWVLRIEPLKLAQWRGQEPIWEHKLDLGRDLVEQFQEFVGGQFELAAEFENGDFLFVNGNPDPLHDAGEPRFQYGFVYRPIPQVICGPAFIVGKDTAAGNPTSARTPIGAVFIKTQFLKVTRRAA